MKNIKYSLVMLIVFFYSFSGNTIERILDDKWCAGVNIHFFAGGPEGDAYASIVAAGAENAIKHTGANGSIIWSGWSSDTMLQQVRESIGLGVDGIAVMGFAGEDAMWPLAKMAEDAGTLMTYMTVDVKNIREKHGGGYVGANLGEQGYALGVKAINSFGLKSGDKAVVFVVPGDAERFSREDNTRQAFEDIGMEVVILDAGSLGATDPNSVIPIMVTTLTAHPDTKIVVHPGGQQLGNAEAYAKAAGYGPNELLQVGFDTSPQVMDGFVKGYIQLTADQQPFMQGYLPVLSLCQREILGLGAITQNTGNGFVTLDNYEAVMELANAGLR